MDTLKPSGCSYQLPADIALRITGRILSVTQLRKFKFSAIQECVWNPQWSLNFTLDVWTTDTPFWFSNVFPSSWPKQMSLLMISVLFLIWEDARIWARKISWVSNYLKACSSSFFSRAQSTSFLISTLSSFQGVLKVRGCSGLKLILAEADSQCQFSVGGAPFCS